MSLRRLQLREPLRLLVFVADVEDVGVTVSLSVGVDGAHRALVLHAVVLEDRSAVVPDGPVLLLRHRAACLVELSLSRRRPPRRLEVLVRLGLVGAVAYKGDAAEGPALCVCLDGVDGGLEKLAVGLALSPTKTSRLPGGRGIGLGLGAPSCLKSLLLVVEDLEAETSAAENPLPDLCNVQGGVALEARGLQRRCHWAIASILGDLPGNT